MVAGAEGEGREALAGAGGSGHATAAAVERPVVFAVVLYVGRRRHFRNSFCLS